MGLKSKFRAGISTLKNNGIQAFIQETIDWFENRTVDSIRRLRGYQKLQINGVSAKFNYQNSEMGRKIRWMYRIEEEELSRIVDEIQEDDVFLDIGANLGLYSVFASRVIQRGEVIACEPFRPNSEELKKNVRLNDENIHVEELAISDSRGTVEFQQSDDSAGSQVGSIAPENMAETFEIETASVDDLVSEGQMPVPNVVKVDVEGAEPLVLQGMERTLASSSCRAVFCEVHTGESDMRPSIHDFGYSIDDVVSLFESKGFTVTLDSTNRGKETHLFAIRE